MSRSKRKTPRVGVCKCRPGEMGRWKKEMSKKIRRLPIEDEIPPVKKHGDVWSSPSDGKTLYKCPLYGSGESWKKLMRK